MIVFNLCFLCFLVCVSSLATWLNNVVEPEVDIANLGRVRGYVSKSHFKSRPIYNFLGINYAQPPSGYLRFQPPEPFEAWTGVYDATKQRARCPQVNNNYYPSPDPGDLVTKDDIEDCLVVNVFTPQLNNKSNLLPVFYYMHGGSFWLGSAYDFFPEFLLDEDIVLVVVQYRLGPLGFLSLQTDAIPGNVGMLDILLSIKWVKSNIMSFGGDPNKITVIGQSAGAAGVTSLLTSPLVEKDLFQQLVVQSGSSVSTWAVDEDAIGHAKSISRLAGCTQDNFDELAACLKKVPALDIVNAHYNFVSEDIQQGGRGVGGAGLVVQKAGKQKFIVEHPYVSLTKGKFLRLPVMGGFTRDEGSSFLTNVYDWVFSHHDELNIPKYFTRNATRDTLVFCGISDSTGAVTDIFLKQYFVSEQLGQPSKMYPGLMDICGTALIKASTFNLLRMMSTSAPTYVYSFHFYGNVSKLRASLPNWSEEYPFPSGVAHSDELGYLFPNFHFNYTETEMNMVKIMVGLWTNFVRTGTPNPVKGTPTWAPMKGEFGPYLRIDTISEVRSYVTEEYEIASLEGFVQTRGESSIVSSSLLTISVSLLLNLSSSGRV